MVGLDGRQNAQRIALGVVQQGRTGYRQIGNPPGVHQVAEIDNPLQLPLALLVTLPDSVVIGDIEVYRLHGQLSGQRLQAFLRLVRGLQQLRFAGALGEYRRQVRDQLNGVPWVPLQRTFKPRMGEIRQGLVNTCAKPAKLGDQLRRHEFKTGE
ncbi:hypothetical protein D3C77_540100 [compost metagenome]